MACDHRHLWHQLWLRPWSKDHITELNLRLDDYPCKPHVRQLFHSGTRGLYLLRYIFYSMVFTHFYHTKLSIPKTLNKSIFANLGSSPGFSDDQFSKVDPELELYTFTELSNGWISLKIGIFISILIQKSTHFLYLAKIGRVKFPKIIVKNATIFVSFFSIRLYTFHKIFLNIDIKIDFLVKNQIVWYTTWWEEI